jgi:hypothetical protein
VMTASSGTSSSSCAPMNGRESPWCKLP